MVMCFVPDCKHYSESHRCSYFNFPKNELLRKEWTLKIRRGDTLPKKYSKVCSCHFKDHIKKNGPTIFERDNILPIDTPKRKNIERFVTPTSASSYKSPLLSKPVKKIEFDSSNASLEELRHSTIELQQKNEELKKDIASLKNEGFEEEQLKWYINKLHEYNDIKDIAQNIMGRIAVNENTTVRKIHEDFGMTDSD